MNDDGGGNEKKRVPVVEATGAAKSASPRGAEDGLHGVIASSDGYNCTSGFAAAARMKKVPVVEATGAAKAGQTSPVGLVLRWMSAAKEKAPVVEATGAAKAG